MKLVERAVSLLNFLESDFGQSGRDVRIEAIVCEFESLLGVPVAQSQAPMLRSVNYPDCCVCLDDNGKPLNQCDECPR